MLCSDLRWHCRTKSKKKKLFLVTRSFVWGIEKLLISESTSMAEVNLSASVFVDFHTIHLQVGWLTQISEKVLGISLGVVYLQKFFRLRCNAKYVWSAFKRPKNILILPKFIHLPFWNQEKLFPIETNGNWGFSMFILSKIMIKIQTGSSVIMSCKCIKR